MFLGPYVPLEMEVVNAMLDLLDVTSGGVKYLEIGAGDGRFMTEAIARGCSSVTGIEIDHDRAVACQGLGLNVIEDDCFNVSFTAYNRFTFWFTPGYDLIGFLQLMGKIRTEGKNGSRLVMLSDSSIRTQNGVVLDDRDYSLPPNVQLAWQPTETHTIIGNRFFLYLV